PRAPAAVHARAYIDQPIGSLDQSRQDVWGEHIDGEYARHAGLRVDAPRLAIADPCVVDHGVEPTEFVDAVCDTLHGRNDQRCRDAFAAAPGAKDVVLGDFSTIAGANEQGHHLVLLHTRWRLVLFGVGSRRL